MFLTKIIFYNSVKKFFMRKSLKYIKYFFVEVVIWLLLFFFY